MGVLKYASCEGKWEAPGESADSVSRRALTNKKVPLCIWRDCSGTKTT